MKDNIHGILSFGSNYLKEKESNKIEAEVLLSYVLKKSKTEIYSNIYEKIDISAYHKYKQLLRKRLQGEPLSYIIGSREFYGIPLKVSRGVLIPRQETEILVEEGIKFINSKTKQVINVLDIGCGCGAISIALCNNCINIKIDAIDISEEALAIASINIKNNNFNDRINLKKSNLFSSINKNMKYDLIISNPPYIPSQRIKNLPIEVKNEPLIALDGGKDGIEIINMIIDEGKFYLNEGGLMLLEIDGEVQERKITDIFYKNNFQNIVIKRDLADIPRIIGGILF